MRRFESHACETGRLHLSRREVESWAVSVVGGEGILFYERLLVAPYCVMGRDGAAVWSFAELVVF